MTAAMAVPPLTHGPESAGPQRRILLMRRLSIETPDRAQQVVQDLCRDMGHRVAANPPGLCPVDLALNFLRLCHAQTCGKCVPCRIGLSQLETLIESVLDQTAPRKS